MSNRQEAEKSSGTLLNEVGSQYRRPSYPTRKQFKTIPYFADSADALIYGNCIQGGGIFQFCTLQRGMRAITNGHWLQIRKSIPRFFLSLKKKCDIFGSISPHLVRELLLGIIDYQYVGHPLKSITLRDDGTYLLESNSNIKCKVDN